jgi:hypothetical protein
LIGPNYFVARPSHDSSGGFCVRAPTLKRDDATSGTCAIVSNFLHMSAKRTGRELMRCNSLVIAGCLTLAAPPVTIASTPSNHNGDVATQQQLTTTKFAQNQDTKQKNQEYNKQDTSKRKSWGGG